jgi:zinc protease
MFRFALPLLLMPALAAAQESVTTFTLANGLEVVVIEDHRAPAVTHMVWYRIGAADEPAGKSGIAHYLEHLMFKGTDDVGPNAFSGLVEALGGDDNAFTSWDYTGYFQRVAAEHLPRMMELEADRMRDLAMTPEDAATELQVILEERAQVLESSPGAILTEQMRAAQFMNHRYSVPIIGWRHEMEALTRDDAFAFYRDYYAPNNAVLVVAGDTTPDEVRGLAEATYGKLAPSGAITLRQRPTEPPQLAPRRVTLTDPRVSEAYVIRTWLAPERNPGDQTQAAALTVLAELLGGNPTTSVLARALQFDTQQAIYTAAFYDGKSLDPTTFGMVVVPVPGTALQDAEAAMDATLAAFLAQGIDDADFQRIKTQLRAADIFARDNVDGLARSYGEALAVGLTVADVQAWPDTLQAVTKEQVMEAARALFDDRHAVTGWLMPQETLQ